MMYLGVFIRKYIYLSANYLKTNREQSGPGETAVDRGMLIGLRILEFRVIISNY